MERRIVSSIVLVFLSILVTITLFELFQIITVGEFSIDEFEYGLLFSELTYFLPFLLYFYIFNRVRKYLARKNPDVQKIQNQYLLGLGVMLMAILFVAIVDIVSRGVSLKGIPSYLFDYIMPVVFVPVIISMEYIYEKKFSDK